MYKLSLITYFAYLILIILSIRATIQKRNKYTLIALVATALNIFFVSDGVRFNYIVNQFTIPISALGLYLVVVYRDKFDFKIFKRVWLPGLVYAFTLQVASDNGIATITLGGTIMMLASLIYLADVYKIVKAEGIEKDKTAFKTIALILFVCQILFMAVFRWIGIYWDNPIQYQTTLITEGPEKGIIASEEKAKDYETIYSEVKQLDTSRKTLFFTSRTWLYLVDGFENCSYSSWIWNISEETVKRFEAYYEINPDKKPEIVYIDYVNADLVNSWEDYGYSIKEKTPSGGYVLEAQ